MATVDDPEVRERIQIDASICGGRPHIRGTRVRVADILELLAEGVSQEDILADYPYLSEADLRAALAFGAAASAHRIILVTAQVLAVKILWDSAQRYPRDARVLLWGRRVSQLTMPLLRTATGKLPRCGPKSARATGTDFHSMGWSSTASTMIVYENGSAVGEPVPGELTRT